MTPIILMDGSHSFAIRNPCYPWVVKLPVWYPQISRHDQGGVAFSCCNRMIAMLGTVRRSSR